MRKIVMALLVLGTIGQMYAQETVLFTAKLKKTEVPKTIMNAVERDFANLTAVEFLSIPESYVVPASLDVSKYENSGYDSYMVTFAGKTSKIMATYNRNGKLMSTVDRYLTRNAPTEIYSTIDRLFPEWGVKDGYKKMTIYDVNGKEKKNFYKLTLINGEKMRKVYLNNEGRLVNSTGRLKM